MELVKRLSANDIRLSRAFRARPVLATCMTSSAVARVVWQRATMYKPWQEMTEYTAETPFCKKERVGADTGNGLILKCFI